MFIPISLSEFNPVNSDKPDKTNQLLIWKYKFIYSSLKIIHKSCEKRPIAYYHFLTWCIHWKTNSTSYINITNYTPHAWTSNNNNLNMALYTHTYIHIHIHIYIYTYIYTYTHTYIHIHIHIYIYTYIYTYTHTYIYIHIHTHTHTHTHPFPSRKNKYIYFKHIVSGIS